MGNGVMAIGPSYRAHLRLYPKRRLFELADWSAYWGEADTLTQRRDARCAPRRKLRFRKSERASSSSATSRRQRSASICMTVLRQSSNEDNNVNRHAIGTPDRREKGTPLGTY